MASDRTHRLVKEAQQVTKLSTAIRQRRRLQEEGIKLMREKMKIDARLAEINEEEQLVAESIDQAGDKVANANAEPKKE
jgi:hypothetical protein